MKSRSHSLITTVILAIVACWSLSAAAQLLVAVSPPKVVANKAILKLAMKNGFGEGIKSARAVCFLVDPQGKMVGQSAKWVIGQDKIGLPAGATNSFNFIITGSQPLATTNLTASLSFSRVVLADGKLADVRKEVAITSVSK